MKLVWSSLWLFQQKVKNSIPRYVRKRSPHLDLCHKKSVLLSILCITLTRSTSMSVHILDISASYHDSVAALLTGAGIIAAANEKRFIRKKSDARCPANALSSVWQRPVCRYPVWIMFFTMPLVKFERLLETYMAYAPKGFCLFVAAIPVLLKDKLFLKTSWNVNSLSLRIRRRKTYQYFIFRTL